MFAKRSQTTTKEVLFCIPDHLQDKNFSSTKQILRHHIRSDTPVYPTTSSHGVFFTHILSPGTFSRAKSTGISDTLKQGPGVALKSAGYQTAGRCFAIDAAARKTKLFLTPEIQESGKTNSSYSVYLSLISTCCLH